MLVRQISVFVENKKGKLAEVTDVLARNNIDISALSIADTTNFGILRMIVDDPDRTVDVIRKAGFTVRTTEVLAVEVLDSPGGLHHVLKIFDRSDISIEYLYSFVRRTPEKALILFKVEKPEKALEVLRDNGVNVLTQEEICRL